MNDLSNKIFKIFLRKLSDGKDRQKLIVLKYHRVLKETDPIQPDIVNCVQFDWQVKLLKEQYNILTFSHAVSYLKESSLPERSMVITFDDGYADNHDIALPVLNKYQVAATFFISTGFLNGGMMWNDYVVETIRKVEESSIDLRKFGLDIYCTSSCDDKMKSISELLRAIKYKPLQERLQLAEQISEFLKVYPSCDLMMTDLKIQNLSDSKMEVGAHTVNHPILSKLNAKDAEKEIAESKSYLEGVVGKKVNTFAYPNGRPLQDYALRDRNMVEKLGFLAAVSTDWGFADKTSDVFQLPRISPWDTTEMRFSARLLKALTEAQRNSIKS